MCCPRKPYTHTQHTAYTHRACHSRSQNPCVSYFWCVFPPRLDRDGRAQRSSRCRTTSALREQCPAIPGISSVTRQPVTGGRLVLAAPRLRWVRSSGPAAPRSRFRSRARSSPVAPAGAAPRYRPAPAAPPPMERRGGARGTPGARHGTGLDPLVSARGRRVIGGAVPVRVRTVSPGPAGPGPGAVPVAVPVRAVLLAPAHR